ncbi:MAG: hypothetical protein ACTSUE_13755, partial [Promethearchaeota archaeon]
MSNKIKKKLVWKVTLGACVLIILFPITIPRAKCVVYSLNYVYINGEEASGTPISLNLREEVTVNFSYDLIYPPWEENGSYLQIAVWNNTTKIISSDVFIHNSSY